MIIKWKGYIIHGNSIWYDEPDYLDFRPFQIFVKKGQAITWLLKHIKGV